MKKSNVRTYFKRIRKNKNLTDSQIAEILGTTKGNFSKFPDELEVEQRKWVLDWLWRQRKNIPPELKAG